MDSGIRVATCKTGDKRLLDKVFESKFIKREGKIPVQSAQEITQLQKALKSYKMASQIAVNNNYTTASISPNPYISQKLNNMDQAQIMKREREDWLRLYYKTLKELETMINVQRMAKDIKRLAEETNIILIEIEETVLMTSINNQVMNTTNITQILENL